MKKILFALVPLFAVLFNGCIEEEAELRFSINYVSGPENVRVTYESPDPMHCAKMYSISTNQEASEIILKCKNAKKIYIDNDPESPSAYTSEEGHWSAEMVGSNSVRIVFEKFEPNDDDCDNFGRTNLEIAADKKGGKASEWIYIDRPWHHSF